MARASRCRDEIIAESMGPRARVKPSTAVALIGLVLTGGGKSVSIHAFHVAALAAGAAAMLAGVAGGLSVSARQP